MTDEKKDNRPLSPEILMAAGWKEVPSELKQSEFDKYEEIEDGIINCFAIIFRPSINRIALEYSNGSTSLRLVKPAPITVEEFNKLLEIVKLIKFKI